MSDESHREYGPPVEMSLDADGRGTVQLPGALEDVARSHPKASALQGFRAVVLTLWREWPDLLSRWLNRLADDLNRFNGRR